MNNNIKGATRTNYFHVKDPAAFQDFMKTVHTPDNYIEVWEKKDGDGSPVFGFGAYSFITGCCNAETADDSEEPYENFLNGLQEHVAENDAVIIMEVGHENLLSVSGAAFIVTNKTHESIYLADLAVKYAGKMLDNPKWDTVCED